MHNNFGTTQLLPLNVAEKTPTLKKYATLSPYITEIEKRKKTKSVLRQNRCRSRNKNESSSKSFRIKEKSAASLNSHSQQKSRRDQGIKYILELVNKANPTKQNKQERTLNIKRPHTKEYSQQKTQKLYGSTPYSNHNEQPRKKQTKHQLNIHSSKNALNGSYKQRTITHNMKRERKQLSFRKNLYESKSKVNDHNTSKETLELCKYGYTDMNEKKTEQTQKTVELKKTTEIIPDRKKFRRNKYEALYSSVNSNDVREDKSKHEPDPIKSESRLELVKKQSNLSINKQMDILAQNQTRKFYTQMRSKEIIRSVEKSTEKYFQNETSYRGLKSNNDIEIYVSTVKNPSLNRKSNASTLNTSEQNPIPTSKPKPNKNTQQDRSCLDYEFDFKDYNEGLEISGIAEMESASQEGSSMQMMEEQTSFERQRKQVEREFFHKQSPQIQWSDEDCKIDQF